MGASCCVGCRRVSTTLRRWPGVQARLGSAGVSDRTGREREGPVATGRPLAQMSPGRAWRPPPLFCPGAYRPLRGSACGKEGKPGFSGAVGGSGAGSPCPWRRNKGGGGGRRPTPEDIRRKGHGDPAPDPPTAAPGKRKSTFLLAPHRGEEPKKGAFRRPSSSCDRPLTRPGRRAPGRPGRRTGQPRRWRWDPRAAQPTGRRSLRPRRERPPSPAGSDRSAAARPARRR